MRQRLRNGLLNAGHTCDTLAGDKSLTCLGADDGAPDMAAVADVDQTFFSLSSDFFKPKLSSLGGETPAPPNPTFLLLIVL